VVCASVCEEAGWVGGGVCCAADGKEKILKKTSTANGCATYFADKHFLPKKNLKTTEIYHSTSQISLASAMSAVIHSFATAAPSRAQL
jgi:hypothetical protein